MTCACGSSGSTQTAQLQLGTVGSLWNKRTQTSKGASESFRLMRNLDVAITPAGEALRAEAEKVPALLASCIKLEPEDAAELNRILGKLLATF